MKSAHCYTWLTTIAENTTDSLAIAPTLAETEEKPKRLQVSGKLEIKRLNTILETDIIDIDPLISVLEPSSMRSAEMCLCFDEQIASGLAYVHTN